VGEARGAGRLVGGSAALLHLVLVGLRMPWLTSLGFAALIGILGTFAGVLWAGIITFAALPGFALMRAGTRAGKRALISAGTVLASVVELYLLLAFAGATSSFVAEFLHRRPGIPAWPHWIVGWYLAISPVLFSGWNLPGAQVRDERDAAGRIALPAAAVGYWIFVVWPQVFRAVWPWVPNIGF